VARLSGACCGLILFSGMLVCGLLAGNQPESIVLRALVGLIGGVLLGSLAGWIGLHIVNDTPQSPTEKDEAGLDASKGVSAAAE
jgi:hypothetical protein